MYKKYICNALLLYTIKCRFLLIMIIVWKVLASQLTYFIWTIFDAFDRLNLDTIINFLSCWKKQAVKGYPRHVKRYICNEKQNVNDLNHISIIKLQTWWEGTVLFVGPKDTKMQKAKSNLSETPTNYILPKSQPTNILVYPSF